MSADNYELDQVKTLKFFRLNCPRDKVTITQLGGRAGLLPISQILALIVKLTRHEPVNRARTHYRLTGDGQIIDNQAIAVIIGVIINNVHTMNDQEARGFVAIKISRGKKRSKSWNRIQCTRVEFNSDKVHTVATESPSLIHFVSLFLAVEFLPWIRRR